MIRAGIVGATGYTGAELLRLLARHAEASVEAVTSRAERGRPVAALFPSLRGVCDLRFEEPDAQRLGECDVVFFATPNGTAMELVPAVLAAGARVIDLSADFRLSDPAQWAHWYGRAHASPELLGEAVYGLPELHRDRIREARLVANPGCYPTSVTLGFAPLLAAGVVDPARLVADAKSGVSGAGRKESLATQYCEVADNLRAYGVPGHRHLPEIRQSLDALAGGAVGLTFVPHLTPMVRGIHATLYAQLIDGDAALQAIFEARFHAEPFVDVLPAGSHPETRHVRGANGCMLSVHRPGDGDTVVVLCVIDNLVKGAAGQAVQNMNLMTGLDERTGLEPLAVVP